MHHFMRKLFKGGKNSRKKTIGGNTVPKIVYLKPLSGIEKAKRSRNIWTISKTNDQCE